MKSSVRFFGSRPARFVLIKHLASLPPIVASIWKAACAAIVLFAVTPLAHAAPPTITGVDVPANGTYPAGAALNFSVFFSAFVTVNTTGGAPRIPVTLDTGGTVYATYVSGSGASTLLFRYTIAAGDVDQTGIVLGAAVELNGGTIQNAGLENLVPTLSNVGVTTGILVEATPLTVTSVVVPPGTVYKAGANLLFTVNFSKPTTVSAGGVPILPIILDSGGVPFAEYISGSGTTQLLFRYTVGTGDLDATGLVLGTAINLNGSTLRDATLNNAIVTLVGVGGTNTILIDGIAPFVVTSNRVGAASTRAISVSFALTFNEAVNGVDLSDLTLVSTGTAVGTLSNVVASGPTTYQVTVNGVTGNGTLAIDLKSSGTGIADLAGNSALVGFTGGQTIAIDNTAPTIAIGAPAQLDTDIGPIVFTVTYTGAELISLSATDVTINATGSALAVVEIGGSGLLTRTVSLTNVRGAGTLGIGLAAGTASDLAGNVALGAGPSAVVATNQAPALFTPIPSQNVGYKTPFTFVVPASTFIEPNPEQTLTFTATGLPPGITFDPVTGAFGGIAAIGTTEVTVTATDNGTPVRSTSSTFTLSVIKAVVTVKADNKTRAYGAANPPLTATFTGFVAGETMATSGVTGAPALATAATTASEVNSYPITVVPGNLAAANYSFVFVPGTLAVTKAPLTITADAKTRPYNTINPPLTSTISGFVNGETASVVTGSPVLTVDVTSTSNAGPYPIVVAPGTLAATNYAFTNLVNGTLTVTPSPVTIVLEGLFRLYNGSPQPINASTTPSGSPLNFTYNGSPTVPTDAGSYTVVATSADPNFAGTATGTLAIAKLSQTITFTLPAVTVGVPVALTATSNSGLPVTFSIVSGNATIAGSLLTVNDTGAVVVRATQAGTTNFSTTTLDRTLGSSSRLAQTISFTAPGNKTADAAPFAIVATASSGLPVGFAVVSGPAQVSGATVTLTGAPGTVAVRLSQVGSATYLPAPDVTISFEVSGLARIVNVSARARSNGNDNPLITGFVIAGSAPKAVLIRGIGPGLTQFGVSGVLQTPTVQLFQGSAKVAENTRWTTGGNTTALIAESSRLGAFPLDPLSADSAFLITLQPGPYTVHVNGGTGVALAEVYDASLNPLAEAQRLVNVSIRSEAGSGSNVLICGFAVTGNAPKRVLIRGVGPALQAFGVPNVLADTRLRIFNNTTLLGENDNWSTVLADAVVVADAAVTAGAFPLGVGSRDAAVVLTLAPGAYTAQVTSVVDGATGIALIEVYELP